MEEKPSKTKEQLCTKNQSKIKNQSKTLFYFEFVDSKIANISEENKSIK